jgi:outer membrane protein OmpA-like peptidoglycan-associated protein
MKAILLILFLPIFICLSTPAKAQQTGLQGINYQAVARNASGTAIALQAIQVKFSILSGSPTGTPLYVEKYNTTTTAQGLFTLVIGGGTPETGSFNSIPWSSGNQYLKVEIDTKGDNSYIQIGVMPFMSVPYALYAANGGSGGSGGSAVSITWLGTLAAEPATPKENEAYYNSTDKRSYIYDNTGIWQILAQDGSPGTALTWLGSFATVPADPGINQAYYNLTDKKSYIYDGSTWQIFAQDGTSGTSGTIGSSISWLGTFTTAPTTPLQNQAYYNSTDRKSYIYDSTGTWQIMAQDGTGWNLKDLEYLSTGKLALTTMGDVDSVKSVNRAWLVGGNTGTNSDVDFIGTKDDAALVIKTFGTAPTNERMRVDESVYVNGTADAQSEQGQAMLTVFSGDALTAINKIPTRLNAINGYTNNGTGAGVLGYNYSNGPGVKGFSLAGPGVYGLATSRFTIPIKGEQTSTNGGSGIEAFTSSPGNTSGYVGAGVLGVARNTAGIGLLGLGNNIDYKSVTTFGFPTVGAGVVGNGTSYGVAGYGTSSTNGTGVYGGGNMLAAILPATGAGVSGGGLYLGVAGFARNSASATDRWGGYFEFGTASAKHVYTYIAGSTSASINGSPTGIIGLASSGTKSTIIKDEKGDYRLLFCTEAPEVLFQDFGTGELENGMAHIALESLMTRAIRVDKQHPMKVFIQLEGECNGVFVTNKSAEGFDVKELQGGKSNVPFTWQIVASRADEVLEDGQILSYSDRRFPAGPGPMKSTDDSSATIHDQPTELQAVTLKTAERKIINNAFSNLQFSTASADIASSSLSSLDKMASLLLSHPEWQLKLSGHTDNEGTITFNQTLSEKRSTAVKQYLITKGVDASKIITIGYGQTKPLATNDSKAAREKNRRVEMEILSEKPSS